MTQVRALLAGLRASFWFLPALLVALSLAVAALLVDAETARGAHLARDWPRLFGAGADGSRALLSAIATSMVTVAGVVFSITIVVLSQASAQFSPRILSNFMRDRPTQLVLGVFVGVFAYCIVVLRTVRSGPGEDAFIPSIAVLGAMLYAIAAIAMLIFFVHHVAQSIQAAAIVERIAHDTRKAIDHLFPEDIGHPALAPRREPGHVDAWCPVLAAGAGYVVAIDGGTLERQAVACDRLLRLCVRVGDFVPEGAPLLEAAGPHPPDGRASKALRSAFVLGRQRTTDQDAGFGLQQLVDVALKALSPGVNDASTALLCIDRLGGLLARLAARGMPPAQRAVDGVVRVIAPAPAFEDLLREVVLPVLANARGDVRVLERLAWALRLAGREARGPGRLRAVLSLATELRREARSVRPRWRTTAVMPQLDALLRELRQQHPGDA